MTQIPLLSVALPQPETRVVALSELDAQTRGASNHLKNALRTTGQLHPITLGETPAGQYLIRDGNRRVAAALALGWTEITAQVYGQMTEAEWALVALGIHNRSPNPAEEARHLALLVGRLTPEGISANTGLTLGAVRARLKLASLPGDVLDLIGTPTLSLGTASRLSRLKGVFLNRALNAVRQAARDEKPFGASALREITVARAELLGARLLACAPASVLLIPACELLAAEVRTLCAARGVGLGELLSELGSPAGQTAAAQYAEVN